MHTLTWILRITAAVILLQTLFFKFTGAAESVFIFSTLGAEPWGRYGSGVVELVTAVLLLVPGTVAAGALLAAGIGAGAVLTHVLFLGIDVRGDGGLLFALAVVVLVCGLALLAVNRRSLPFVGASLAVQAGR